MNFFDLRTVVNLYKDANLFAKIRDIRKWTLEGLKKYSDYNFVYEQKGNVLAAISAIKKRGTIEINDIAVKKAFVIRRLEMG